MGPRAALDPLHHLNDLGGLGLKWRVLSLRYAAVGLIVLAIYRELGLPVLFVGVGEAQDDLVPFDPADYARALLEDSPEDAPRRAAAL